MKSFRRLIKGIPGSLFPFVLSVSLLLSFFSLNSLPQETEAATLVVNTLADNQVNGDDLCTLREAILAANADADFNDCTGTYYGADTITFSVTGTLRLGSELPLIAGGGGSLTISGPGSDQLTISGDSDGDGTGDLRVLAVNQMNNFRLEKVTIADGVSAGNGGGLLVENSNTITINQCRFSANRAGRGGAVAATTNNLILSNCLFENNQASGEGGGVYAAGNSNELVDNLFSANQADRGGGLYQQGANLFVSQNTFAENRAVDGGGIYAPGGNLNMQRSNFSQNAASGRAGGIYAAGNTNIHGSTFAGNQAESGGALQTSHNFHIFNSTLYNNQAVLQGGGILSSGATTVVNSTFFGNGAADGGGLKNGDATKIPGIQNTILAASSNGGNCSGLSASSNLGNNLDSGDTCGWGSDKGSLSHTDPALAPLADNGGPTKTMALLPGSTAINGVVYNAPNGCPATDQRGVARPQDGPCDIGAFEFFWRYLYLPAILK